MFASRKRRKRSRPTLRKARRLAAEPLERRELLATIGVLTEGPASAWDLDRIIRVDYGDTSTTVIEGIVGSPVDLEVAEDGSLLVLTEGPASSWDLDRIIRVDPAGTSTTVVEGIAGSPVDLEIAEDGSLLVLTEGPASSWDLDRIIRVDPAGTSTTVVEGIAGSPVGLEIAEDGSLLVLTEGPASSWDLDRIIRVDHAGTSTTVVEGIAGSPVDLAMFPPDTDDDGLLDYWETHGLDVNLDGVIDLDLPALGADPMHKDLFVEVDAMTEDVNGNGVLDPGEDLPDGALQQAEDLNGNDRLDPGEDVPNGLLDRMAPWVRNPATGAILSNNLDDVVAAFAAAPNALVQNPDGRDGVDLHILADEDDIPIAPFPDGFRQFNPVKADHYGTRAERADPNWANIREAKSLVYRYCLFAGTHHGTTSSGQAEWPGDDFMVTLWGWSTPGGTPAQQRGTFMHELGHNLGLHHGGADGINYKPNYHSVMNYFWTVPDNVNALSWELDYSRVAAATLDEDDLDESVGCGFPGGSGHDLHLRWIWTGAGAGYFVPEVGPADWSQDDRDGDGVADNDRGVRADINLDDHNQDGVIDADDASPGQVLRGHDDWSNLRYGLYGHRNFADGDRDDATIQDEFTYESRLARERMMPKLVPGEIRGAKWHDRDGDGAWDPGEPGLGQWLIYVDANQNGERDPGEISTYTDGTGHYRFTGLEPGAYTVAEGMQPGWKQTAPGGDGTHTVLVLPGEVVDDVNFGNTQETVFDGTPGDDVFELYPDDVLGRWIVRLGGERHELDATGFTLTFDGAGGRDTVRLTGTAGDDRLELWPDRGKLTGDGYAVTLTNVETVLAYGSGGNDQAFLHDDATTREKLIATPDYAKLYNNAFFCRVAGFGRVHAYASGGGDVAMLYDDATTQETLDATPDYAQLHNGEFCNRAIGFRYVHAFASGGDDRAYLYDDPATRDVFVATPEYGSLYSSEFYNRAIGFRYVFATASGGGDVAKLYDDPATQETFFANPDEASLYNDQFSNQVAGFRYVHAFASGGGDVAFLYDDPATQETFKATPKYGRLYNSEFFNQAVGFRYVNAYASGGGDVAKLYDDPNTLDTFVGTPDYALLLNSQSYNRAMGFRYVHAIASGGGDIARLYDDANTKDTFVATPKYSRLYSSQFYNRAVGFRRVEAYASGGGDRAYLYDSKGDDYFRAVGALAELTTPELLVQAHEFARVKAISSAGGSDTKHEEATDYVLEAIGPWLDV